MISNEVTLLLAALNETVNIHATISSRNYSTIAAELASYQLLVGTAQSQSELLLSEVEGQFERVNSTVVRLNELDTLLEAARDRAVQTSETSQQALDITQQAEDLVIRINVRYLKIVFSIIRYLCNTVWLFVHCTYMYVCT